MSARVMATLAEQRHILDQQFGMVAAVWCMTIQAVFLDGRMFKHKGPSFLCMALKTEFVDRIGFELIVTECTMRIMAICTGDQSFPDRMVRLSVCLRPDIFVAIETEGRQFLF